jgi:hypothetical protein
MPLEKKLKEYVGVVDEPDILKLPNQQFPGEQSCLGVLNWS